MSVALLVSPILAARAAQMNLRTALLLFPGDLVVVPYTSEGQEALEAAIDAFKRELGVPEGLDETREVELVGIAVGVGKRDLLDKLSQCYFALGNYFLADEGSARETYLKGRNWGLKSLGLDSGTAPSQGDFAEAARRETDVAALFWTSLNWLRSVEETPWTAIQDRVPDRALALLERAFEIDPTYAAGGPCRALGGFWGGLPPLLGIFCQSLERARGYFCRVVEEPALCGGDLVSPECRDYLENRLIFVRFYLIPSGLWKDAAHVLETILAEPIGERYPLQNARAQEEARGLLAEVNAHR